MGVAGGSLYFLQRGIHTVTALPLTNFVAVVTVAVSLFLFTGFLLLQKNVDRLFTDAARDLSAGCMNPTSNTRRKKPERVFFQRIMQL